ncbi:MAG: ParA family protein [Acidimicrobiia bacterium]|nr:ParA family protein [Acidimicrobiia bacterium]
MRVLAFAAVKGGVGKTTAAVNVAVEAANSGARTLIWDLDPQGATCHLLGIDVDLKRPASQIPFRKRPLHRDAVKSSVKRLSVIPADMSLRNLGLELEAKKAPKRRLARALDRIAEKFDVVILDLPAGIDLAVESALQASGTMVVPIVPSTLSVRSFDQFREFAAADRRLGKRQLLGFVSMLEPTRHRQQDFYHELRDSRDDVLETWIPATVEVERACDRRLPVSIAFPGGRAAAAYKALWEELA